MKFLLGLSKWKKVVGFFIALPIIIILGFLLYIVLLHYINIIPVDDISELEKTNYKIIYYDNPDRENLISSEINGENKKELDIPKLGECSPDFNFTLYSTRVEDSKPSAKKTRRGVYLYNFKTKNRIKLIETTFDFNIEFYWAADKSKFAVLQKPDSFNDIDATSTIFLFDNNGQLLYKEKVPKENDVSTKHIENLLGTSTDVCDTKHQAERLGLYDLHGTDLKFLGLSDSNPGLYYKDKMLLPFVEGFKGGPAIDVENILPDGKIVLSGPKSTECSIFICPYSVYVYEPETDSLYRITDRYGFGDIYWRSKDK